jgi:hypothetical protein
MTRKTRLFFLVAGGVLVVGLGTGLVASYMGLPTFAVVGSDGPEELKLVPADAKVVAYANVRDVMNSELRQKVRQLRPDNPQHGNFETETGINIENDIDAVVASIGMADNHAENALVIARGRFDQVRIEGLIREHGGQATDYKGKRLLTHRGAPNQTPGHDDMALAFVEPGLVAFGTAAAVREAVDRWNAASSTAGKTERGRNITDNAEVMGLVRDIDDGNAWAVGRFEALASRAKLPAEVTKRLPPINWFAASGHVNGGLRGMVRAEAHDEAAAQNLRDVVRGFMALARLQSSATPELSTLVNSLEIGGDGKTVSLAFSVPSDVIDLLGAAARRHGATPDVPLPAPPAPRAPRPPRF